MKILHLIHSYGFAGAEKHLMELLPELNKYGFESELICICWSKGAGTLQEHLDELQKKGVKTRVITWKVKLQYFPIARKIARYMKANHIQVIHTHLIYADLVAALIKTFFYKKVTLLSTKHGYTGAFQLQAKLEKGKMRHDGYYYGTRWIINHVDHNLAVSKVISDLYYQLKLGKSRMKYVHHGISAPPVAKKIEVKGNPKIIMVGRLEETKGHIYLIHALPQIIKKFPGLKLILLGEGPLKEELVAEATRLQVIQHIDFIGFATPSAYTWQCQVMVAPSLFEAFGIVYIEAFALKIPLVAFDGGAADEVIDQNETGILVPQKDSDKLAEKIIFLLENPGERKRLTENAYNKFKNYYTVERMSREVVAWYHSVLDKE